MQVRLAAALAFVVAHVHSATAVGHPSRGRVGRDPQPQLQAAAPLLPVAPVPVVIEASAAATAAAPAAAAIRISTSAFELSLEPETCMATATYHANGAVSGRVPFLELYNRVVDSLVPMRNGPRALSILRNIKRGVCGVGFLPDGLTCNVGGARGDPRCAWCPARTGAAAATGNSPAWPIQVNNSLRRCRKEHLHQAA